MSRYVLAISGASGAIYASRVAMYLKKFGHFVSLIVTETAKEIIKYESQESIFNYADEICNIDDFFCECASGSSDFKGMVVVPCSMGTLGRIAHGTSDNLLVRSADVCLKEHKTLVVVPREMPYNLIHIENMKILTLAGAIIIPASPQFYSQPKTIEELVDTVVVKILKHLGIESVLLSKITKPWDGKLE